MSEFKKIFTQHKQKYGESSQWKENNPNLLSGQLGFETDTKRFKLGEDLAWNSTDYYIEYAFDKYENINYLYKNQNPKEATLNWEGENKPIFVVSYLLAKKIIDEVNREQFISGIIGTSPYGDFDSILIEELNFKIIKDEPDCVLNSIGFKNGLLYVYTQLTYNGNYSLYFTINQDGVIQNLKLFNLDVETATIEINNKVDKENWTNYHTQEQYPKVLSEKNFTLEMYEELRVEKLFSLNVEAVTEYTYKNNKIDEIEILAPPDTEFDGEKIDIIEYILEMSFLNINKLRQGEPINEKTYSIINGDFSILKDIKIISNSFLKDISFNFPPELSESYYFSIVVESLDFTCALWLRKTSNNDLVFVEFIYIDFELVKNIKLKNNSTQITGSSAIFGKPINGELFYTYEKVDPDNFVCKTIDNKYFTPLLLPNYIYNKAKTSISNVNIELIKNIKGDPDVGVCRFLVPTNLMESKHTDHDIIYHESFEINIIVNNNIVLDYDVEIGEYIYSREGIFQEVFIKSVEIDEDKNVKMLLYDKKTEVEENNSIIKIQGKENSVFDIYGWRKKPIRCSIQPEAEEYSNEWLKVHWFEKPNENVIYKIMPSSPEGAGNYYKFNKENQSGIQLYAPVDVEISTSGSQYESDWLDGHYKTPNQIYKITTEGIYKNKYIYWDSNKNKYLLFYDEIIDAEKAGEQVYGYKPILVEGQLYWVNLGGTTLTPFYYDFIEEKYKNFFGDKEIIIASIDSEATQYGPSWLSGVTPDVDKIYKTSAAGLNFFKWNETKQVYEPIFLQNFNKISKNKYESKYKSNNDWEIIFNNIENIINYDGFVVCEKERHEPKDIIFNISRGVEYTFNIVSNIFGNGLQISGWILDSASTMQNIIFHWTAEQVYAISKKFLNEKSFDQEIYDKIQSYENIEKGTKHIQKILNPTHTISDYVYGDILYIADGNENQTITIPLKDEETGFLVGTQIEIANIKNNIVTINTVENVDVLDNKGETAATLELLYGESVILNHIEENKWIFLKQQINLDEFLTGVETDGTIEGDGTIESPLGVIPKTIRHIIKTTTYTNIINESNNLKHKGLLFLAKEGSQDFIIEKIEISDPDFLIGARIEIANIKETENINIEAQSDVIIQDNFANAIEEIIIVKPGETISLTYISKNKWIFLKQQSGANSLEELTDVNIEPQNKTQGSILIYNTTTNKFEAQPISVNGGNALSTFLIAMSAGGAE